MIKEEKLKQNQLIRMSSGGLNSALCKCGREWKPRWDIGCRHPGYHRICPGCGKKTRDCTCKPL